MVVLAGIDLAWSGRKPTGVCVLQVERGDVELAALGCLEMDAPGTARWLENFGPDVVAGVDAPLIVGPGRRAEALLARAYGRRGVYAYSARQDFLERHGIAEGPRLGTALINAGWNADPSRLVSAGRHALEVFPHATTVALLGAEAVLRYKKGRLADRDAAIGVFQALLRSYVAAEWPQLMDGLLGELLSTRNAASRRALKAVEDQLDALACAVAAHHAWRFGAPGLEVFGNADDGYIAVPRRR